MWQAMMKAEALGASLGPGQAAYQLASLPHPDPGLVRLGLYLSQAVMLEVCVHPKPGLVTRCSQGAHLDMDILTFAASSAVLAQAFADLLELGLCRPGSPQDLFQRARAYGVGAEREMLQATKGVNTQRGILFSGGLLCAAAGYCLQHRLGKEDLLPVVRAMTAGLVERELANCKKSRTAGEQLYRRYGIIGIRGEIEQGFPSVVGWGLPALTAALAAGASLNDALVHSFIQLLAVVEDSNVVWRAGTAAARQVKEEAARLLELGSVFTPAGRQALAEAERAFVSQGISPGGSADLLSITIALYLLENKEFPTALL